MSKVVSGFNGSGLKLSPIGFTEWQKTFGGPGWEGAFSIEQTGEGEYAVAGFTDSFGTGNFDYWIVKLSSTGLIQWQNTYGGPGTDQAYSVHQTNEGGYIVSGRTNSFGAGSYDYWIIKLSSLGGVEWEKTYGGTGFDSLSYLEKTSNGGYIVSGLTYSFGVGVEDGWILKLNSAGAIEWERTYGGSGWEETNFIQETAGGGYVFAGYIYNSLGVGNSDFFILKVSSNGNIDPSCGFINTSNAVVNNTNLVTVQTDVNPEDTFVSPDDPNAILGFSDADPTLLCSKEPIAAIINIDPNTLSLKSKGKWITVYISLPEEYDVTNINIETVKLLHNENSIDAAWGKVQDLVLMVKFERSLVQQILSGLSGDVELKIIGELEGILFEGVDTIRVKN